MLVLHAACVSQSKLEHYDSASIGPSCSSMYMLVATVQTQPAHTALLCSSAFVVTLLLEEQMNRCISTNTRGTCPDDIL